MAKIDAAAKAYIADNYLSQTDREIGDKFGISEKSVSDFRKRQGLTKDRTRKSPTTITGVDQFEKLTRQEQVAFCRQKLKSSPIFHTIEKNYTKVELDYYIEVYTENYAQLRRHAEVTSTEELQIHSICQLEILVNNNNYERKQYMERINELDDALRELQSRPIERRDMTQITDIMEQIRMVRQAQTGRSDELTKLTKRRDEILHSLKTTRDQRFDKMNDKTDNFFSLVKIVTSKDNADRESREMELARLAMENQVREFGKFHEFMDGEVDQILINEETVSMIDDAE